MSTQNFPQTLMMVVAIMGLAALVEAFAPLRAASAQPDGRRRTNLAMTAITLLFNWALTSAIALFLASSQGGPALLARAGLPPLLQALAGFVVLDFAFGYLSHRLMHQWPLLWRIHRVHHSDPFVDVTTTYRNHPAESAWRYLFVVIPGWVLGVPATTMAAYRLVSALNAVFEHANVCLNARLDSLLTWLWVTPNMHKVHHSRDAAQTDTNYSNILSFPDRLLGTFTPSAAALHVEYGLDDVGEDEGTLGGLLAMPFRSARSPGAAVMRSARA